LSKGKRRCVLNVTSPNGPQIVHNTYLDDQYDPTIEDIHSIPLPDVGYGSQLELIDTSGSGQETYEILTDQNIREAEGIILFYSITSFSSFRMILDYHSRVRSLAADPILMLIGTKCDVDEREVSLEKGRHLASEMGAYFQEVSAKEGTNTERVHSDLKRMLTARMEKGSLDLHQQLTA
jgi:GTPase SAR1 family protein